MLLNRGASLVVVVTVVVVLSQFLLHAYIYLFAFTLIFSGFSNISKEFL